MRACVSVGTATQVVKSSILIIPGETADWFFGLHEYLARLIHISGR